MRRRWFAVLLAITAALIAAPAAGAATITVDDDGAQCPAAQFQKIQNAIDNAITGDTIAVCPGTYVEGNGGVGTDALIVSFKNLTIKGAGADLVTIQPKRTTATGGQIASNSAPNDLRDGFGDIVAVIGSKAIPATVNISGVTIDGNGVYSEAGVVYRDAGGQFERNRVTNIVTSESNTAESLAGGYRYPFPGVGIAQVTSGTGTPAAVRPALNIDHTRINRYNKIGVLIDSATNDTPPLTASTVTNTSSITGSSIIGRTQCTAFNTPAAPPYIVSGPDATPTAQLPGNCSAVGLTTVGTTFGQDGVRVTAGSTTGITDSTIVANLVNGTGAPTQSYVANAGSPSVPTAFPQTANNANLPLAAGVRLIGGGASSIHTSNLNDNAYGVYNVGLNGTTANTTTPVNAENNYWGNRVDSLASSNTGPPVSPTVNPYYQQSAVNGGATVDPTCVSSTGGTVSGSDSVDFCPFRNGNQADPNLGQLPVAYAPLPVSDSGPAVDLSSNGANFNRGDTVTLTAHATDDFGIAKVTFYDGTSVVGTATLPSSPTMYTTSYSIPSDAPCAARAISAVAEDSTGQTASDSGTITVVGPNGCNPVVPPTPPGNPTVKLTGVPATVPEAGATVGADVTVDPTLTATGVAFSIGDRKVCTDSTAPYTCDIQPTGAEVGGQAISATVTDSANQTATDEAQTNVAKFATTALSIKVKGKVLKGKKPKKKGQKRQDRLYRVISGGISFNNRVTQAQGCSSGSVTLTVEKNGTSLFPYTQVPLNSNCGYVLKFKVPKTKKHNFTVEASFGGNSVLLPISNNRRFK